MNIIKKPIKSFKGDGKFVYVCYSLEDSEVVFPILIKLDENRCRVRYDECNQDEVKIEGLRKHNIKNCEVFLAFLSQKALQSLYVVNQLETAQTLGANVFVVSLDGQETADSASHMFGEGSKGIRLDETDENSFMEVMDQLLKDCQEPEKIEERVFSYEELLDEVYPDQENANKEAFINNTDTDN
ncbi:MAG: TIR domain-containing protein, partial [Lachnospiraceae bacterium]|nr:TIR domain-containing protein [Lachnospiraceae bacterium]